MLITIVDIMRLPSSSVLPLLALVASAAAPLSAAQSEAATYALDAPHHHRLRLDAAANDSMNECHRQESVWQIIWSGCVCAPCDHCYLNLTRFECESSDPRSGIGIVGGHNGAAIANLSQPLLDPSDWFLTEEELIASRGGVPRSDLQLWTDGNDVSLFPSTDRFFASVYEDIEALQPIDGDDTNARAFLVGWSLDDVPFMPQRERWNRTSLRRVVGRALRRGVDMRALVWANTLEYAQNAQLQLWMNGFELPPGAAPLARFLFDNRVPHPTATHHQKTVLLYQDTWTQPVAYVGGVDLDNDRWDTAHHNESVLRRRHRIANGYAGWIDASSRLRGPAANDVAANFLARWNSPQPPLMGNTNSQTFTNPLIDNTTNASWPPLASGNSNIPAGNASVQIVRTFSCKVGYDFAPLGELSLLASRVKAIGRAKNFIYVEDQYFVLVPALLDALLAQLPHIQALVVVAQMPELSTQAVGYGKLFFDMVAPLQVQFPGKVHVFVIKPELQVYIHTKVVLIDDVYLSIGSANWNRRSMSSDSEIAAAIVDHNTVVDAADGIEVVGLARQFRLDKFSEFSGRSVQDLAEMSLSESVAALDAAAADPNSIFRSVDVHRKSYFDVVPDELISIVDPFDECSPDGSS